MKKLRLLILSHPGAWQRVLQMNIEAYPFVKVVEVVSGSLSASQLVSQHQIDLVLIDSSIPFDDAVALVQNVKLENPETRSIVITDTTQQSRRITWVGADYTLSSYHFESQIGTILDQMRETLLNEIEGSETTFKLDPRGLNNLSVTAQAAGAAGPKRQGG
jgi:DNA-binding NarL/FixJ family response regulator